MKKKRKKYTGPKKILKRKISKSNSSLNSQRKFRKSFLPALVLAIVLWGLMAYIIYFVDPYSFLAIPIFFATLFTALLLTFSVLFANARRGSIVAVSVMFFLLLRYLGIGNAVNFILIFGLAAAFEYYFHKK
jgi:hypothetical protein